MPNDGFELEADQKPTRDRPSLLVKRNRMRRPSLDSTHLFLESPDTEMLARLRPSPARRQDTRRDARAYRAVGRNAEFVSSSAKLQKLFNASCLISTDRRTVSMDIGMASTSRLREFHFWAGYCESV
jgi:hypothetical protein